MGLNVWFSLLLALSYYEINSLQNFTNNSSISEILNNTTISTPDLFKNTTFNCLRNYDAVLQNREFINNKITQKLVKIFQRYQHNDQSIVLFVIQYDSNQLSNMVLKNLFKKKAKVVVLEIGPKCDPLIFNKVIMIVFCLH